MTSYELVTLAVPLTVDTTTTLSSWFWDTGISPHGSSGVELQAGSRRERRNTQIIPPFAEDHDSQQI